MSAWPTLPHKNLRMTSSDEQRNYHLLTWIQSLSSQQHGERVSAWRSHDLEYRRNIGWEMHPSLPTYWVYTLINSYSTAIDIIGLCHRIVTFGLLRFTVYQVLNPHIISSDWLSPIPYFLSVSTLQPYIITNVSIRSSYDPYCQHDFISSHKIIKSITS